MAKKVVTFVKLQIQAVKRTLRRQWGLPWDSTGQRVKFCKAFNADLRREDDHPAVSRLFRSSFVCDQDTAASVLLKSGKIVKGSGGPIGTK
jgi:hypothetical protein